MGKASLTASENSRALVPAPPGLHSKKALGSEVTSHGTCEKHVILDSNLNLLNHGLHFQKRTREIIAISKTAGFGEKFFLSLSLLISDMFIECPLCT